MSEKRNNKRSTLDLDVTLPLRLEELDLDLFRSVWLYKPRGARGVYGGQLVANAVEAACQSVDLNIFAPHSIHSTFLKPGSTKQPVYFRVSRLRDGKSFTTRNVVAQQRGEAIFLATISFHRDESCGGQLGIRHGSAFPGVPPPELGVSVVEFAGEISRVNPSERFSENLRLILNEEEAPMQIRYLPSKRVAQSLHGGAAPDTSVDLKRVARYCWMKFDTCKFHAAFSPPTSAAPASPSAPAANPFTVGDPAAAAAPAASKRYRSFTEPTPARAHMLIACWCSDLFLALAGLIPHGFPNQNVEMLVSLDHTIYFHNSHIRTCAVASAGDTMRRVMGFPVDEWFLYEVHSPHASNCRALNMGRIFSSATGLLEMTIIQESLVRMKKGYVSHL